MSRATPGQVTRTPGAWPTAQAAGFMGQPMVKQCLFLVCLVFVKFLVLYYSHLLHRVSRCTPFLKLPLVTDFYRRRNFPRLLLIRADGHNRWTISSLFRNQEIKRRRVVVEGNRNILLTFIERSIHCFQPHFDHCDLLTVF